MTREQVNALRAAGIEDKTIVDLIIIETADAVAPKPEPAKPEPEDKKQEPAKPEPEDKKQEPEPKTNPEPQSDKILAAIEKLTGAVLSRNVAGTGREDEPEADAEKIMGELLRGRK